MSETDKEAKNIAQSLPDDFKENMQKMFENLHQVAGEVGKTIHQAVEAMQEFGKQHAPLIASIVKSLREIPSDFLAIQQTLSERGWFVLAEMPLGDYRSLKTLIDASKLNDLDDTMIAWTSGLLDETEKKLCGLFPDREALLREGFDNHRTGKYASAITLLLTQADGICFDILQEIFFKTKKQSDGSYLPAVKDKIDALGVDALAEITLHPILTKAGINASDMQIVNGEFPNSPHRHPILHGRDNAYPSEINSLKIISFLGYLGGVVYEIIEEAKNSATSSSGGSTP